MYETKNLTLSEFSKLEREMNVRISICKTLLLQSAKICPITLCYKQKLLFSNCNNTF